MCVQISCILAVYEKCNWKKKPNKTKETIKGYFKLLHIYNTVKKSVIMASLDR